MLAYQEGWQQLHLSGMPGHRTVAEDRQGLGVGGQQNTTATHSTEGTTGTRTPRWGEPGTWWGGELCWAHS